MELIVLWELFPNQKDTPAFRFLNTQQSCNSSPISRITSSVPSQGAIGCRSPQSVGLLPRAFAGCDTYWWRVFRVDLPLCRSRSLIPPVSLLPWRSYEEDFVGLQRRKPRELVRLYNSYLVGWYRKGSSIKKINNADVIRTGKVLHWCDRLSLPNFSIFACLSKLIQPRGYLPDVQTIRKYYIEGKDRYD